MGRPHVLALAAFAASALLFAPRAARADSYMYDGVAALGTGFEGGDPGGGSIEWHRARTRIVLGADLRSDEDQKNAFGFRAFAELERRGGIGAELRYTRWVGRGFGGFAFATAVIAPETLVGGGFGATFVIPFGKSAGFQIEPSFSALPVGTDVPDGTVVLWANLSLGVRVGL